MTATAADRDAPPGGDARARPPVGLYLHVPFCISLCPYCDFVVYPGAAARGARNRIAAFVRGLLTELELRADAVGRAFGEDRPPLASVYLGGGTPSLLPADDLATILHRIRDSYGVAPDAEITLEANPGPAERGDLPAAADAGINRISFGAQSMDPGELRRLGRRHGPHDVAEAVAAARTAGVGSVSVDLLYDVPGQTEASWERSLDHVLALRPDHLSLYALTLDDPSAEGLTGPAGDHLAVPPGACRWRDRARREQDDDRAATQYRHAVERLADDGWRGYELSNWARPGHESRHNLAYWQRRPYDALGPGAHAFDGRTRRWNAARLDAYLAALADGRLPPGGGETIDDAAAEAESLILGLRMDDGVLAAAVEAPRFRDAIDWATAVGLASHGPDGRIRLTTRGRLLGNELFARLV